MTETIGLGAAFAIGMGALGVLISVVGPDGLAVGLGQVAPVTVAVTEGRNAYNGAMATVLPPTPPAP